VDSDPAGREATESTLAAAADVLRHHVSDGAGWCLGCLAQWGRLVFIEQCTQVQWAAVVRSTYGTGWRDDRTDSATD
jgi:hypothetical protein